MNHLHDEMLDFFDTNLTLHIGSAVCANICRVISHDIYVQPRHENTTREHAPPSQQHNILCENFPKKQTLSEIRFRPERDHLAAVE